MWSWKRVLTPAPTKPGLEPSTWSGLLLVLGFLFACLFLSLRIVTSNPCLSRPSKPPRTVCTPTCASAFGPFSWFQSIACSRHQLKRWKGEITGGAEEEMTIRRERRSVCHGRLHGKWDVLSQPDKADSTPPCAGQGNRVHRWQCYPLPLALGFSPETLLPDPDPVPPISSRFGCFLSSPCQIPPYSP